MANENSGKPGHFKYKFIHKGDKDDPLNGQMDVALEYAGSEAKVYAMRLQTLTGEATYLRCKGCPRHAAEKHVFFEHVKAAEKQTARSMNFNALRMKSACAEHVRLKKVVMRGNNNKVLSIDGQLNRPLGHYLG